MVGHLFALVLAVSPAYARVCQDPIGSRTSHCAPAGIEQLALQERIQASVQTLKEFRAAADIENRTRRALSALPKDHSDRYGALEEWEENFRKMRSLRERTEREFADVADLVQASYGLRPPSGERRIANGPFAGQSASWRLGIWMDPGDVRRAETPDGNSRYFSVRALTDPDEQVAGVTQEDGRAFMTPWAFEVAAKIGPSVLAQAILHESVHFDQLTGKGWGSRAIVQDS